MSLKTDGDFFRKYLAADWMDCVCVAANHKQTSIKHQLWKKAKLHLESFISHVDIFIPISVGMCTLCTVYTHTPHYTKEGEYIQLSIFKSESNAFSKACLLTLKTHQTSAHSPFSNDFVKKDKEISRHRLLPD